MLETRVLILNAPPRAGKDLAADHLVKTFGAKKLQFKDDVFKVAAKILCMTVEEFKFCYEMKTKDVLVNHPDHFKKATQYYGWDFEVDLLPEWWKDVVIYRVADSYFSTRGMLIHASENVVKPVFGDNAFGKVSANNICYSDSLVVFSDGGFVEEVMEIIYKVGKENVFIVHVERENCTFEKDSRNLLTREDFDETMCPRFKTLVNDGTSNFTKELDKFIGRVWDEEEGNMC